MVFPGFDRSPAFGRLARDRALRLDHFCADMSTCRVSLEMEDRHRQQGRSFTVRPELTLPGHELNVSHVHDEDIHIALRDAFDAMQRQLEDAVRRMRQRRA
ncbi:HPF/RaiA family ribosome-associated protein [Variovorax sp. J22R133]|uniref:HPF/RaiA family ribosome-associated protein n=1 Tax=Variovorax brevis TaxID=3053503 RepID=UPI002576EA62|nr:HPF/RaiA family ribosome-associated protein [Variovorax sp. J22R133]MDM0116350.1 HPF/RaiA family ribosome-associated protein [Variovorax sp. J22R133]